MGYDMYLRGEPSADDQEKFRLASVTYEAALAAREAIPKLEQGARLSDATKARFEADPEGTKDEANALYEAMRAKADEFEKQGIDFFLANQMAGEVPPTERYVEAQKAVLAAADAKSAADKSYFRLNIWGMSAYCQAMSVLDMLKEPLRTEWPDVDLDEDPGVNDAVSEALQHVLYEQPRSDRGVVLDRDEFAQLLAGYQGGDDTFNKYYGEIAITDEHVTKFVEWANAHDKVLSQHHEEQKGIGGNKFDSNDGWIVTPAECAGAVEIWESHTGEVKAAVIEERGTYWLQWIDFLRAGADADGFSVH